MRALFELDLAAPVCTVTMYSRTFNMPEQRGKLYKPERASCFFSSREHALFTASENLSVLFESVGNLVI